MATFNYFTGPLLATALLLTSCITNPNLTTGAGCWRYGVAETNQIGLLTRYDNVQDVPITRLPHNEFTEKCGLGEGLVWACYQPWEDHIYLRTWKAGTMEINHEKCHALLGFEHNACNGLGYSIGKNATACDWDQT